MNLSINKLIYWIPRIIGILYTLFLSIFTLDAFTGSTSFWNSMVAFLIHLLPALAVLIILIIAWRWPFAGGILFIGLTILFFVFFNHFRYLNIALMFEGPLLLTAILFIIGGLKEKQHSQ